MVMQIKLIVVLVVEWELERGGVGVGAYWRWALIRGWALIRINTVTRMSLTIKCFKQTTSQVASTSVLEQSEHKPRSI